MEAFTAATILAASEPAAMELFAATEVATSETLAAEATVAIEAASAVIATSTVIAAAAVVSVEPRTGTDENSPIEVVRTVVTVRGTSIRGVIVISVCAGRRRSYVFGPIVYRPHPNPYSPTNLSVGTPRECH
jgi:hypothetical protein